MPYSSSAGETMLAHTPTLSAKSGLSLGTRMPTRNDASTPFGGRSNGSTSPSSGPYSPALSSKQSFSTQSATPSAFCVPAALTSRQGCDTAGGADLASEHAGFAAALASSFGHASVGPHTASPVGSFRLPSFSLASAAPRGPSALTPRKRSPPRAASPAQSTAGKVGKAASSGYPLTTTPAAAPPATTKAPFTFGSDARTMSSSPVPIGLAATSSATSAATRASTLPTPSRSGSNAVISERFTALRRAEADRLLTDSDLSDEVLILDLRPHSAFSSTARLHHSINLCVPSTLLRRPNYALSKIIATLPHAADQERMRSATHSGSIDHVTPSTIIVLDQDSTSLIADGPLHSLLAKFERDGYSGQLAWIKGGFNELLRDGSFMAKHVDEGALLDHRMSDSSLTSTSGSGSSLSAGPSSVNLASSASSTASSAQASASSSFAAEGFLQPRALPLAAFDFSSTQQHKLQTGYSSVMSKSGSQTSMQNPMQSSVGPTRAVCNPFFDTIRQNQESLSLQDSLSNLAPFNLPPELEDFEFTKQLPDYLQHLVSSSPIKRAQQLAHEFHDIEATEQKRLQEVMSWHASQVGTEEPTGYNPLSISAGVEKGHLNRYKNIFPYDHARCRLQEHAPSETDYINASHITFRGVPQKKYIASQGPVMTAAGDFWQLVLQEQVGVVVMLTHLREGGREKCSKYYAPARYGDITVECAEGEVEEPSGHGEGSAGGFGFFSAPETPLASGKSGSSGRSIVQRTLLVRSQKTGQSHTVQHVQFGGWPDFDVPPNYQDVLDLIGIVNKANDAISAQRSSPTGPIVVHCSAGVGRTGSYMLIDVMLDHIRRARSQGVPMDIDPPLASTAGHLPSRERTTPPILTELPMQAIVQEMREQRMSMIANLGQYRFCHEAILQGLKAHPA